MGILSVSINRNNPNYSNALAGKARNRSAKNNFDLKQDTFAKREDRYTKAYKALVTKAYSAERNEQNIKIQTSDIQFLLDIKDYDKFREILSTPVVIKGFLQDETRNLFFYTDANATRELAKRLNQNGDRVLLKKLFMQTTYFEKENVFHKTAKEDDTEKMSALKDNLSMKEFKKFIHTPNIYGETPYSTAEENCGDLMTFFDKLFDLGEE